MSHRDVEFSPGKVQNDMDSRSTLEVIALGISCVMKPVYIILERNHSTSWLGTYDLGDPCQERESNGSLVI